MKKKRIVARRWLLGASFAQQCSPISTRAQRPAPSASPRQGILLLVVLSMLTLFLLIGTAFIVSANHYRQTNKMLAKLTETSNSSIDQGDLLNEVINQVLRDTDNQNSTLRFHSLLRDMYGNDGILASINAVAWAGGSQAITGGQMLQFEFDSATLTNQLGISVPITQLSQHNNAYSGLVLTFLDGVARGQSVRIVGYLAPTTGPPMINVPMFRVTAPRLADGTTISNPNVLNTSRVLINGRPFNGTGVGYNNTAAVNAARLSESEAVEVLDSSMSPRTVNAEVGLVPNAAFFDFLPGTGSVPFKYFGQSVLSAPVNRFYGGLGGSDESYDAVDFQNMVLALMPMNPGEKALPVDQALVDRGADDTLGTLDDKELVIPSLHRPALLNYWTQNSNFGGGEPELYDPESVAFLRKILLRPNWHDHPNFTGSNPEFANLPPADALGKLSQMIYGPWDVDNDNDGIRDSVWVDFGAPVMENSDGRLVKPLAAILVLDMDGRLNLNAHGSEEIANAVDFYNATSASGLELAGFGTNPQNNTDNLPQGQGYGPAEISLAALMPPYDPSSPLTHRQQRWKWYKRLFRGADRGSRIMPDMTTTNDFASATPTPRVEFVRRRMGKLGQDNGTNFVPGETGFDLAAQLKMQGVPPRARVPAGDPSPFLQGAYVTPPDFKGRYALGLNNLGQPVHEAMVDAFSSTQAFDVRARRSLLVDTPYETNLSLGASRGESVDSDDGPYTMAELERVLRAFDPDSGALPSRIWEMAGMFKDNLNDTTPNLDKLNLWRRTATTDSYDLPVPSVVVPEWMRVGPDGALDPPGPSSDDFEDVMNKPAVGLSFADLLEYRIRIGMNPSNPSAALSNAQLREMRKLLPRDLADGLRLDINRPLGNGRDDNNNGVVDEPGEFDPDEGTEAAYWASNDSRLNAFTDEAFGSFRDDYDRNGDGVIENWERGDSNDDGIVDSNDDLVALHNFRRQMLARDLYVMAQTLADPLVVPAGGITDATYLENRAKRARQLAQWAINVVDYRDPDGIMTAFEYDVEPFDGWNPDGNLFTEMDIEGTDSQVGTDDDTGGVVWGAEQPELLITETLAWHDRRAEDGAEEVSPGAIEKPSLVGQEEEDDSDFDQEIRPQGVGFVELYNPWPANPAANQDTHRVDAGDDLGVDIGRTHDLSPTGSPVWRLNVYKTINPENLEDIGGPHLDPNAVESENRAKGADRSVYFTTQDPNHSDDGVAYFASSTNNPVEPVPPGGFLVVGGGESSGVNQAFAPFGAQTGQVTENNRGIRLDSRGTATSAVAVRNSTGTAAITDFDGFRHEVAPEKCSVALITEPVGFSFSEPPGGYLISAGGGNLVQFDKSSPAQDTPLDDQRSNDLAGIGLGGAPTGDLRNRDGESRLRLPVEAGGVRFAGGAGGVPAERARRTIPGFSWVYLQRLANPTLPWNPEAKLPDGSPNPDHRPTLTLNPYLTVDSMGVNVTVFNGLVSDETRKGEDLGNNRKEVVSYDNDEAVDSFASVQRGRANLQALGANNSVTPDVALLELQRLAGLGNRGQSTPRDPDVSPTVKANLWAPAVIGQFGANRLGFERNSSTLERDGVEPSNNTYNFKGVPDCTLGFLNEPFRQIGDGTAAELQTPEEPFPWLSWNNRPFANPNELLQVPAFRSSQIMQAFAMRTAASQDEAYDGDVFEYDLSNSMTLETDGPFGHLLNFFRTLTDPGDDMTRGTADDLGIAGLHRLLDYVHVPSPYVGTETWMNPARFGNANVNDVNDPRYLRQPPFNRIAEYREPGRINLNTIISAEVWDGGVLHRERFDSALPWNRANNNYREPNPSQGIPGHSGPLFVKTNVSSRENGLMETRRGYTGGALLLDDEMLLLDPNMPTFFANPFRSPTGGSLVPLPVLQRPGSECTLLRRQAFNAGADGKWGRPNVDDDGNGIVDDFADFNSSQGRGGGGDIEQPNPSFASSATGAGNEYWDAGRNSYFGYQPMARLSSMTTTRSNVYAVWVTIGFFEVQEVPDLATFESINDPTSSFAPAQLQALYKRVYPEGYQFGQEAGSETGNIQRVREFAMIDRTVPVAFEPGQNHNVEKAIRLRRRIE